MLLTPKELRKKLLTGLELFDSVWLDYDDGKLRGVYTDEDDCIGDTVECSTINVGTFIKLREEDAYVGDVCPTIELGEFDPIDRQKEKDCTYIYIKCTVPSIDTVGVDTIFPDHAPSLTSIPIYHADFAELPIELYQDWSVSYLGKYDVDNEEVHFLEYIMAIKINVPKSKPEELRNIIMTINGLICEKWADDVKRVISSINNDGDYLDWYIRQDLYCADAAEFMFDLVPSDISLAISKELKFQIYTQPFDTLGYKTFRINPHRAYNYIRRDTDIPVNKIAYNICGSIGLVACAPWALENMAEAFNTDDNDE